jgi:quercetin dioxygenase-like cupin family protein
MSELGTCELISQDDRTKVWRWTFESGQETGMHIHEFDYIATPIVDGDFQVTMSDGSVIEMKQEAGQPYSRNSGVHHNVKYVGQAKGQFIEIEFLY